MDDRLVFNKTAKGVAEIAVRSTALSTSVRRLLILIDGKRTVAELAPLFTPGAIGGAINLLESEGYIARAPGFEPTRPVTRSLEPSPPAPLGVNPAQNPPGEGNPLPLDEAKRRAVRELVDRLGPEAETMSLRIEQCRNGDELLERLREAERLVAIFLGAAAAQDYVRALRSAR